MVPVLHFVIGVLVFSLLQNEVDGLQVCRAESRQRAAALQSSLLSNRIPIVFAMGTGLHRT